ncbi:MAG: hypothetical protein AB2A00_05835 [Myxococcota bacterium]
MRRVLPILALAAAFLASCAVRQVPLHPALEPLVDDDTPRSQAKQVVALVMDQRVAGFRRDRDFSLVQEERYSSGEHFMRSLLAQLRARGVTVLEVENEQQAAELGAPYTLIPDTPGVNVIRPKGLLDFSFLGSLNRISVSYSVRLLRPGARIPERISGSGSRTASFFWSNALLQSVGLSLLGASVSIVIYSAWFGITLALDPRAIKGPDQVQRDLAAARCGGGAPEQCLTDVNNALPTLAIPPEVGIMVFIADELVSQATAQVVPRVINPLVDIFINEPRWQSMVQGAHDEAAEDLADAIVARINKLGASPRPATTGTAR